MATSSVVVASAITSQQARFTAGQIPDQRPRTVRSAFVETGAGIGFGKAVSQGAADDGVLLTATGAETFVGVTCVDQGAYSITGDDVVAQGALIGVLTHGSVVVQVSVAVDAGEAAYAVTATGVFTNVSTGNIDINGVFETSAAQDGLAVLRLK